METYKVRPKGSSLLNLNFLEKYIIIYIYKVKEIWKENTNEINNKE